MVLKVWTLACALSLCAAKLSDTGLSSVDEPGKWRSFDQPVAFTVTLRTDICSPSGREIVPYNHVILNHGEAFSTHTHRFTAPVRGLYSFTFTLVSCWNGDGLLQLIHENSGVVTARSYSGSGYVGNSASAMLHLEQGDQVWVDIYGSGFTAYGHESGYNSFSGHLYAQL